MKKTLLKLMLIMSLTSITGSAETSYTEAGHPYEFATLKGIRIGDDFQKSCDKLKMLVAYYDKDNADKFKVKGNTCGYYYFFAFGLESDSEGVSSIKLPIYFFGYDMDINPINVKKIAQDYLNSDNRMVENLKGVAKYNELSRTNEAEYYGYNRQRDVMLEITFRYMHMKKVPKGNF